MEVSASWLLEALSGECPGALNDVFRRHRCKDDSFDLNEVLKFFPNNKLPSLAKALHDTGVKSISHFRLAQEISSEHANQEDFSILRAISEMVWGLVRERKGPIPSLRPLIIALHDALLEIPNALQNFVAKTCEALWHNSDPERDRVVPCTILYLLARSFGEESAPAPVPADEAVCRPSRTAAHVRRVYAMRKALDTLHLSPTEADSSSIRELLLKCPTSPSYIRLGEGRKFIAHLLTVEDIQEGVFESIFQHLKAARKSVANSLGTVLLLAWKQQRSEWLARRLMRISEQAICAGSEPFASNLKGILSAFHANKRVNGVDLLLHNIYGPVLYKNLMVANPLVRRNAVSILADGFPIHDPGSKIQDIEAAIGFQCGKLFDLLNDPSPVVRRTTVEGACRILGLFWELVPLPFAKRFIDAITSRLALDASSAQVRLAVFEGLEFLVDNHLSHQILSVALPRLSCIIHDNVERVRLSFLDLLLTLKSKRIESVRYFDVVAVDDLLLRLPRESPAVAAKIMQLILTSYFPLKKKGKTGEEVASSQTRACLSMLGTSRHAARYFYKHLNLHAPPGPLLEFAMRMSSMALEAPVVDSSLRSAYQDTLKGTKKGKSNQRRHRKNKQKDENEPPFRVDSFGQKETGERASDRGKVVDRVTLLNVVADVLLSISPSLEKEANSELKWYVDDIYGGEALKPMLVEKGNIVLSRAACWRIASCISVSKVQSITGVWREEMDAIVDWRRRKSGDLKSLRELLSALILCGMKWNMLPSLSAIVYGWSGAAITGSRTSRVTSLGKLISKSVRRRREHGSHAAAVHETETEARADALLALWACGDVICVSSECREELAKLSSRESKDVAVPPTQFFMTSAIRKGCLGALDYALEADVDSLRSTDSLLQPQLLFQTLTTAWKLALGFAAESAGEERLLQEVRELLIWSASDEVWKKAFAVGAAFPLSLSSIFLGGCADFAALGYLNEQDSLYIETMAKSIRRHLSFPTTQGVHRPVVELLRLAFHLREQFRFSNPDSNDRVERQRCLALKASEKAVLGSACEILGNCVDGQHTCMPNARNPLNVFFRDTLLDLLATGDHSCVREIFAPVLVESFKNPNQVEPSLFASLTCNTVISLINDKRHKNVSMASELFSSIVRGLRGCVERVTADRVIGSFSWFLASELSRSFCGDGEDGKDVPGDNALEFFARLDGLLEAEFPHLDTINEEPNSEHPKVVEARKILVTLRNMGEREALQDDVERQRGSE